MLYYYSGDPSVEFEILESVKLIAYREVTQPFMRVCDMKGKANDETPAYYDTSAIEYDVKDEKYVVPFLNAFVSEELKPLPSKFYQRFENDNMRRLMFYYTIRANSNIEQYQLIGKRESNVGLEMLALEGIPKNIREAEGVLFEHSRNDSDRDLMILIIESNLRGIFFDRSVIEMCRNQKILPNPMMIHNSGDYEFKTEREMYDFIFAQIEFYKFDKKDEKIAAFFEQDIHASPIEYIIRN